MRWSNRLIGRSLVVGRDQGLRFQYEFIFLFEFEFRLACLGRFLRNFSRWYLFGLGRRGLLSRFSGDAFRLERNCRCRAGGIERHERGVGGGRGRRVWGRTGGRQFRIRQTSGALEAAAQCPESFGAALVARFTMDLFQLRSEFGGAPVVTCAEDKVEQFFECRRVARRAAQNGLQQTNGFLCKAVPATQVYLPKRLPAELLCLFV